MDAVSPELVALLAACRARPADDLPRLVLADWLDENGQPERAEFVRVQVELSHPTADAERTAKLRGIEERLLKAHEREWVGGYLSVIEAFKREPLVFTADGHYGTLTPVLRFVRGMMRLGDATSILAYAAFRNWLCSPDIEWLEQVGLAHPSIEAFVKADLADELHGRIGLNVRVGSTMPDTGWAKLCRLLAVSSNFTAVRHLSMKGVDGLTLLRELARADLSGLVHLAISPVNGAEAAANTIASAPFTALSSLDLGPLTASALNALIRSPYLGNLTELNLVGSDIRDVGMISLCGSRLAHTLLGTEMHFDGITHRSGASFPNTGISDTGVMAFVKSPLFANMHGPRLNLMMNRIGDVGISALAESEHLLRFRELVLRENKVGDAGAEALAQSPYAANMRYIDFWRNNLTDRGAFALARSPYLNKVVDLCVKENQITEAGAAALHERFGEAAKV